MNDSALIKNGEINLTVLYSRIREKFYLFFVIILIFLAISNFFIYRYNLVAPTEGKINVHISSNSIESVSNTLQLLNELIFDDNDLTFFNNFSPRHIYNNFFDDINLLSQQKKIIKEASNKFNKPFTKSKYKINVEKFSSVDDTNSKIVVSFTDQDEEFILYLLNKLIQNSSERLIYIFNEKVDRFISIAKIDIEKRLESIEYQVELFNDKIGPEFSINNKDGIFTEYQKLVSKLNQQQIHKENFDFLAKEIQKQQNYLEIMDYDEDYIVFNKKTISYLFVNIIALFFSFIFFIILVIISPNYNSKK